MAGVDEPEGVDRPAISIIVPTFARPSQLDDCLRSLVELDYPRDRFEVIVVDDGTPGPPGPLDEVLARHGQVLDLRVLRQENQGPGAARNAGAAIARAPLLAFTDDDCRPERGWLRGLEEAAHGYANSMIGGRTVNGLTEDACATASQIIVDVAYAHYNADAGNARFLASNNLAVPRDRFLDLGGFDADFRVASEDRDLCDRWLHAGRRMVVAPKAVVVHRHHQSLIEFVGLHFRYGRGARRFHAARAARGSGHLLTEARFHARFIGLLRRPLRTLRWGARLRICLLLPLWQGANACGFLCQLVSGDRVRAGNGRIGADPEVRRRDAE